MNKGNILIVDDTHASLQLLSDLLTAEGYAVRPADSGELALASVAAKPPELILLDIRMPGMDGFEVMRRLKAREESRDIPVIFLSAATEAEQRVSGLRLGAVDYISKPFQREELLARVQIHMELRRTRESLQAELALRTTAEAKAHRFSQLYAALSQCNQAIVRCTSEEELFPIICRDAVQFGGMKMARIICIDPTTRIACAAATFGEGSEELPDTEIPLDVSSPFSLSPIGIAIREGRPYWCQVFMQDPVTAPWHEYGAKMGWGSAAVLPLHRNGVVIGAFTLYSAIVNAFDEEARKLLLEMTTDIDFALDNFEREAERKKLERELIFIAKAVESSSEAIGISDSQGHHFFQNRAFTNLYGYINAEELEAVGGGAATVKDPEVAKEMYEKIMSGKSWAGELDVVHKNGRVFPAYERADAIKDDEGKIIGLIGVITDITERKRAESQLRESEQRFRLLVDKAPDGIYLQTHGCFKYANEKLLTLLGAANKEQLLGKSIFDRIHPDSRDLVLDRVRKINQQHLPNEPLEEQYLRLDGTPVAVEVSAVPLHIYDEDGALVFVRDITERRMQEQLIRESEKRFRNLVEQSLTGIYIVQKGAFTYTNPRMEEMLGYGPGELVGVRIDEIVISEDLPLLKAQREKLRTGETSISYSPRLRRKDGRVIEVGVQGSQNEIDGSPATIGMAQDITEKKLAEEQIQQYVKQLKTAFMSTVNVATILSEMRDPYTAGHERRVAQIAVAIGTKLGLDADRLEGLQVAGFLHDVGKINIPSEILSKPGKLSAIEFELIQGHAQASFDILKNVEFPWPVAQAALQHHERIDGSGYPQGLKGEAILLEARIMAVADVVEAMSSHRPYRAGLGIEAALAEIERGRGTAYDPVVADACLCMFRLKHYQLGE